MRFLEQLRTNRTCTILSVFQRQEIGHISWGNYKGIIRIYLKYITPLTCETRFFFLFLINLFVPPSSGNSACSHTNFTEIPQLTGKYYFRCVTRNFGSLPERPIPDLMICAFRTKRITSVESCPTWIMYASLPMAQASNRRLSLIPGLGPQFLFRILFPPIEADIG